MKFVRQTRFLRVLDREVIHGGEGGFGGADWFDTWLQGGLGVRFKGLILSSVELDSRYKQTTKVCQLEFPDKTE